MVIGIDCSRAFVEDKTGTENYSYHLIKHMVRLPEADQHQFVLFTRPKALIPGWVGKKNVQIRPIHWRYLWTQIGLAGETWKTRLNVLWVPSHTLPILRKPGMATVVTIHGLEYQWLPEYRNWLQSWYLPLSTMYAAARATQLIAVSKFTRSQLHRQLHTDSKKVKVVYEGVEKTKPLDQSTVDTILTKYGLQDKRYILFVGSVQPRKNLVALTRAFAQFTQRNGEYKLVIAGGMGWMAEEVLRTPREVGISEKVVFTGRVADLVLHALYQGASVYAQPSVTEGFGLPIIEAMASGVPVVASDGGALPEVVQEAGLVVPLGKDFEKNLARGLERVIKSNQLRVMLVKAGKQRVSVLTWQKAAAETFKVLTNL